jgi:hypothetical protein
MATACAEQILADVEQAVVVERDWAEAMTEAYERNWDEALAMEIDRAWCEATAYERAWNDALVENERREKSKAWTLGVLASFDAHKLLEAKMNADPLFRLLTYEHAELEKRLRKSKSRSRLLAA